MYGSRWKNLRREFPVWVTDVNNLGGALAMITDIGRLTGTDSRQQNLVYRKLTLHFSRWKTLHPLNTAYLIWKDPYMTVGGDTFINDYAERCGFNNIFQRCITVSRNRSGRTDLIRMPAMPFVNGTLSF